VSEFHVERERNAYGKLSNYSDTLHSSFSRPRNPSHPHAPSRTLGPGSDPAGPETCGPLCAVAYLLLADIVSRPLPCRLHDTNQPVISKSNQFSTPR